LKQPHACFKVRITNVETIELLQSFGNGDSHGFLAFFYLLAMPVLLTDHRKRRLILVCLRMMREGE